MVTELKVGDEVAIGEQLDEKNNFLYWGYRGEITEVSESGEYAFVDSEKLGKLQTVSFKTWLPTRTLTLLRREGRLIK